MRKGHISFEFVDGVEMEDPEGVLEGAGKYRRHLKFSCLGDVKAKDAGYFVRQLVSLAEMKNEGEH